MRLTPTQVKVTRDVCAWYLQRYHRTQRDLGVPAMFQRNDLVGKFSVTADEWRRGEPRALFRVLVATTLFQRRQDQQILRILRGMLPARIRELSSSRRLLSLVDRGGCALMRTQEALIRRCDLDKNSKSEGMCSQNPGIACHLKQHTTWLKRYGHFGKVPTSAALMLREHGARDLDELYQRILAEHPSPRARAEALEQRLRSVWRISEKIAAMFLSLVCDPDLSAEPPPWTGIDPTYFVVIDSNTDLFLASIGYRGSGTYQARRAFIWELAKKVDLAELKPGVSSYSPRIVQQAAYLFMSKVNRRSSEADCWRDGVAACRRCPVSLRARCPVSNQGVQGAGSAGSTP